MSPGPFSLSADSINYTVSRTVANINTVPQKVVAHDPTRVYLQLTADTGNVYLGGPGLVAQTNYDTFLSTTLPFYAITYGQVRSLVMEEWWAVRAAGSSTLGILQVFYRPSAASL